MLFRSIGVLIVGDAGPAVLPVRATGELMLWVAAALTCITGYDYLRAGLTHMQDAPPLKSAPIKSAKPRGAT